MKKLILIFLALLTCCISFTSPSQRKRTHGKKKPDWTIVLAPRCSGSLSSYRAYQKSKTELQRYAVSTAGETETLHFNEKQFAK